ncbi:hypothetical protein B0A48_01157 [Cryoendolithus antarcticus]|uniref:Structure-specific endonuclease subunit SLX4 n=1 Tax=Cryoendolithus antarcticus TaxID=1507870 RepID=A0A1V8TSL9_9PEZI|nr:hypothetical protein B0A48_01157 [Cryoendolithus antarcticus]
MQVPDGAHTGFTTARSLHTLLAQVGKAQEDGVPEIREQEAKEGRSTVTRSPHGLSALRKSTTPSVQAASPDAARRPSISLSEFSFNGDAAPAAVSPIQLALPVKKSREKTESNPGTSIKPDATKKSRKPKAKSESIILNSDEPDESLIAENADSVKPVSNLEGTSAEYVQHNEASPRRPDLSMADFAFHTSSLLKPIAPAEEIATAAKSKRKRIVAKKDNDGELVLKRPKVARTKSKTTEAAVDNSAEPNVLAELSINTIVPSAMQVSEKQAPKARKSRAKKVALPPFDLVTEGDTPELLSKQTKTRKPRVRQTTEQSTYFASVAPAMVFVAGAAQTQPRAITDIAPEEEMNIFSQVNVELDQTLDEKPFADFLGTLESVPGKPATKDLVGEHDPSERAPRRRRSWTPTHEHQLLRNVKGDTSREVDPDADVDGMPERVPMAQLLQSFTFAAADGQSMPQDKRAGSVEAQPKRRKIKLEDRVKMPPPSARKRKSITDSVDKPAKKPKLPKKKPQTITALATAAYLPVIVPEIAQPTVSSYFDTVKPNTVDFRDPEKPDKGEATEVAAKIKKPRKSRAKVPNGDGTIINGGKVLKVKAKAKVKFKEDEYRAPLCTPGKANAAIMIQDFVFGTSSQLAAEESPTFIREMQLAIRQSEVQSPQRSGRRSDADVYGTQIVTQMPGANSPTAKSYSRVPTAPHGTDLSILQAERELWCSGSRDYTGGMLEKERASEARLLLDEEPPDVTIANSKALQPVMTATIADLPGPLDTAHPVETAEVAARIIDAAAPQRIDLPTASGAALDLVEHVADESESGEVQAERSTQLAESVIIDLSYTSPIAEDSAIELPGLSKQDVAMTGMAQSLINGDQDDDGWALLRSDISLSSEILPDIPAAPLLRHSESILRKAHSPARQVPLPAPPRTALRPLDTNMGIQVAGALPKATSLSIARSLTSATAGVTSAVKKPRGRPRKDAPLSDVTTEPVKRARGRPRKDLAANNAPVTSEAQLKSAAMPIFVTSPPALQKQHSHPFALSQPAEWANIDEISDLESPATPSSRRRRRATSSPPTIRPLEFSPPISPSIKASTGPPLANLSNAALKPTDPEWLSQAPALFPKITATITSSPPSTDLKHPSWYEKILLYDPIVLEDLTAYLNGKGVRISVRRPKPKVKGKKKSEDKTVGTEREWEVVGEELRGWMVQKWCEEFSICCLWREGLRGGVKGNY